MSDSALIFKIVSDDQWQAAQASGVFHGAPVDLEDGFLHFSAAHQVVETARRHFQGQDDLWLLAVAPEVLGDSLKWEVSRGGDRFPHLYRSLHLTEIAWARPLPRLASGELQFPELSSGARDASPGSA